MLERFIARVGYVSMERHRLRRLSDLAAKLSNAPDRIRVFYLATAPDIFGPICARSALMIGVSEEPGGDREAGGQGSGIGSGP